MSYNFLVKALKRRIMDELKLAYSEDPNFKNVELFNKFPYKERIAQGVILRNSSAARVPLSADNFQGTVKSYVAVAKHSTFPSKAIEWVREDEAHLSERIIKEDYSSQFTGLPQENKTITVIQEMVKGGRNLNFANSSQHVEVYVNNQRVIPSFVDGENKIIILSDAPATNSKVEVSYSARNLAPSGVYQIEITSGDRTTAQFEFMVDVLLNQKEVLIEDATGSETSVQLNKFPIFPKSLKLRENGTLLTPEVDYTIDEQTGIITFLQNPPVLRGSNIEAQYRSQGLSTGPFKIPEYDYAINTAIPGVVLAFGSSISLGDKHFLVINDDRDITAQEFSGKWDMSLSFDINAKDSQRIEEIVDKTTTTLLFNRKSELDGEGIYLVDVNFSGESEEIYDDATGDLYYRGTVDYTFMTEWILHRPLLVTIEGIDIISDVLERVVEEPDDPNRFEKLK